MITLVAKAATISATAGWSTLAYGATACGLFGISAIYHRVTWATVQARIQMKRADQSMIFAFMAGCYTPQPDCKQALARAGAPKG